MNRDAYSQVKFDLMKGFVWLGHVSVTHSFYSKVAGIEDEIIQGTLLRFNGLKTFFNIMARLYFSWSCFAFEYHTV